MVATMLCRAVGRVLACFVGIALVVASLGAEGANAQEEELLSAAEAMDAVASNERLEPKLQEAEPTQAELIYVLLEGEYVPRYWMVLLSGAEGPVGVVGIDPETGALGIEYAVEEAYSFPEFSPTRWRASLADHGIDPERYDFGRARLVWFGGMVKANTWVVPPVEGAEESPIVITAFPRGELEYLSAEPQYSTEGGHLVYRLGDLLPETRQSDWAMTEDQDFESGEAEEVTPLAKQEFSKQVARTDTQLVSDVPYYFQGNTQWCALFALSMLHQWWSPTQLGTGRQQAQELGTNFLVIGTGQGADPRQMKAIMNNWDKVDQDYQDFRTTYYGVGEHPIEDGLRGEKTDEIKTMITHLDAPVVATVDTDGGGSGSTVDHVVLVTGYDDKTDKLFFNNSGAALCNPDPGAKNAVSYSDWNNKYWNAIWWDNSVDNTKDKRYGIVTGYPGDMDLAKLSSVTPDPTTFQISDITDAERAPVNDIGLTIANDHAKGGGDAFGEIYATTVEVSNLNTGPKHAAAKNVSSGDFDNASAGGFGVTYLHDSGLQQGGTLGGGSVEWDPAVPGRIWNLGDVELEFTYTAYDREDRHHYYGSEVLVHDDRGSGKMRMPKPVLLRARKQFSRTFTVTDDDDSGPLITDPNPSPGSYISDANWPSGPLSVQADVTDPSGVKEVTFHYEVLDADDNRLHSGNGPPSSQSGSTYEFDIPRSSGWAEPGRTIKWEVEATDDDMDGGSPDDRATDTSPEFSIHLYDDDSEGPTVSGRNTRAEVVTAGGQKKVEYEIKFKLEDPSTSGSVSSGVLNSSTSPKVYVRWGNKTVTPNKFDRSFTPAKNNDWFGTGTFTAPIDKRNASLYWLVETKDTDSDRSGDRATATPGPFELRLPPELVITPNPPDHDFGADADGSWSFTVENTGGGNVEMWGEVDGPLQQVKPSGSSIPTCKRYGNGDRCWLSLSGLSPLSGQNTSPLAVSGGTKEDISINVDYEGFSYQVEDLSPGAYKAPIKIWDDVKHPPGSGNPLEATIRFSVPDLQITAPQKGNVVKKGDAETITWNSSFMSSSEKVKIELLGATTAEITKSTANDGSYTWQVPASTNDGQHQVKISPVELPSVSAKSARFDVGSIPPARPANQSPPDGARGIADPLTLEASSFADPNQGDSHQQSQWQIRTDKAESVDPPAYGNPSSREPAPVWETTETGPGDLTSIQVPQGTVPRHRPTRLFTVEASTKGPLGPNGNVLRVIETQQCQKVIVELENPSSLSAEYRLVFQYGGDHISEWVSPGQSDRLSFRVDQRGSTQWSLQRRTGQGRDIVERATLEVANAKYWWHVRYQDDQGKWSKWSKETSFCALEKLQDDDGDGVADRVEDKAPGGGDGNGDGTEDAHQARVASLPNTETGDYVTLESQRGALFRKVKATEKAGASAAPPTPNGFSDFPAGFVEFVLQLAQAGNSATVTMTFHGGTAPTSYWKFGPTPNASGDHWYEFSFNGTTGAQISGSQVTLRLTDGRRGDHDLEENGLLIEPGGPAQTGLTRALSVAPGWNMVSMPLKAGEVSSKTLGSALPDVCGTRYRWDPEQGSYQEFGPEETLPPGGGAWTFCEEGGTATVKGTPVSSSEKTVSVKEGWNQVGPFEEAIAPGEVGQEPSGLVEGGTWYRWAPDQGRYAEPSELTPGAGYWVFATEGGTLDFSSGGSEAATAASAGAEAQPKEGAPKKPEGAITLQVTDQAGHGREVYLAPELTKEERRRWRLPPRGPGGAFDVRFAGGFRAAQVGGMSQEARQDGRQEDGALLRVRGAEEPVTLRLQTPKKAPEGDRRTVRVTGAATGGERLEARLTGESPSATVPAGAERLRLQVEKLPQEAALRKPYPNPASGPVTLEYELPEERDVTIRVYDVLGRRVATLADGRKRAGSHRALLEASQLPSGTYFARMQAEGFQKTRRVVILR